MSRYPESMGDIGLFLRTLREEAGLSMRELGRLCGVSTSFLSQMERGMCSISIPTLETICTALGLTLAEFFGRLGSQDPSGTRAPSVVLKDEQRAVTLSREAIRYRFLSVDFPGRLFEIVIGEIPEGYVFPKSAHAGEEAGYLLSGRLRLSLADGDHDLVPGDSYHIGPFTPHGYEALDGKDVSILWVQTLRDLEIRKGQPKAEPMGEGSDD